MKVELTHDIIAEKVWEKLPEQDKQLRLIRNSLQQRLLDYKKESGSLLGEKELLSWEDYFGLLELNREQKKYITNSKKAIDRQKQAEQEQQERELRLAEQKLEVEQQARKKQRIFIFGLGILAIAAILTSIWAINSQQEADKKAEIAIEAEEVAADAIIEARKRIGELAINEYNTNLAKARNHRQQINLLEALEVTNIAIGVLSKFDSTLLGTGLNKARLDELKISWDNNGRQAHTLKDSLESELPGLPQYEDFMEKGQEYEGRDEYIEALKAYRQAKEHLNTAQVQSDIRRMVVEGFNYYRGQGKNHLESRTTQDYRFAENYFEKALQLKQDATVRALLEEVRSKQGQ